MTRYYLIATALVVLFGSIVFAHRLTRPNLHIVAQVAAPPRPETPARSANATAPPFSGQGSWVLSALPGCFDEQSVTRGPAAELAARVPPAAARVASGTTLRAGDCTLVVRRRDIWIARGSDHLRVPPDSALYAVDGEYELVTHDGPTLELRRYTLLPAAAG